MSTLIVYASAADDEIYSTDADYLTARAGAALALRGVGGNAQIVGQQDYGQFSCHEAFEDFDASVLPDNSILTAAVLYLWGIWNPTTTAWVLQARYYNWGVAVTTDDWLPGAELAIATLLATKASGAIGTGAYFSLVDVAFPANVSLTDPTRIILHSDRFAAGDESDTYELISYATADAAGTTQDPKLIITYTAAVGAEVQVLWNTQDAVGEEVQALWNVHTPVAAEVQALWNVRTPVGVEVQVLWDLSACIGAEVQALWNTLDAVGAEIELLWQTRQAVRILPDVAIGVSTLEAANKVYVVSPTASASSTNTTVDPTYAASPREMLVLIESGDAALCLAVSAAQLALRQLLRYNLIGIPVPLRYGLGIRRGQVVSIVSPRAGIAAVFAVRRLEHDFKANVTYVDLGEFAAPRDDITALTSVAKGLEQLKKESAI